MKYLISLLLLALSPFCLSQVIINEVQSSNSSTISDNFGNYDDWIEIYNPNSYNVEIGGLVLKDNVDIWKIPTDDESTLLTPYSYFILWADDEEFQGKFHTNFKLSAANGEFLGLYDTDSTTVIDHINIPPLNANTSYGRCNNGWVILNKPTPKQANNCAGTYISESSLNLKITPFINNGKLHFTLPYSDINSFEVFLFSIEGKLLQKIKYSVTEATINLSHYNSKMFILKILTDNNVFTKKLIVE